MHSADACRAGGLNGYRLALLCGTARRSTGPRGPAGLAHALRNYIAGPYVLGALNTDRCPAGTYYIGSEADCRAAGLALSLAWGSALNLATVPRWCSASTTNVYFNAHPIGAGFVSARPVCLTSGTATPTNVGDTWTPTLAPNVADALGKGHAPSP